MQPLPDYLAPGLTLLFIGFNPGLRSAELGHHYAGRSNRFWSLLEASHLTPRRYAPQEDGSLLELGYGLTNIVHRPTREAAEITKEEYAQGREGLLTLLHDLRPKIAAFVGIGVYKAFSPSYSGGMGDQGEVVEGVRGFVLPSPSGLNRIPWEDQLQVYQDLRQVVEEVRR